MSRASSRIVRAVADAAERWRNADFPPRVRATRAIMERLAYSEPMVDLALDRLFSGITVEALHATIASELGSLDALDGFASRPGRPDAYARGVEHAVIIASDTTIGVAIPPLAFALCANVGQVVVKDRSDALVAAFAQTLIEEEPLLAARLRVEQWEGDDVERSRQAVSDADVVVAFGRDETMRAIRAQCKPEAHFVPFGHRISVGYIPREALGDVTTARCYARGAAVDALLYEGEGCLSLRALFVECGGKLAPTAFAELLAHACEEVTVEFPSARSLDPRVIAYRKRLAFRIAQGEGALHASDTSLVALDPPRDEPPPLLARVIPVYAANEPCEMLDYLRAHHLPLEAIAVPSAPSAALLDALLATGAARITTLGTLQDPPLSGNHGGQGRIAPFVTFVYRDVRSAQVQVRHLGFLEGQIVAPDDFDHMSSPEIDRSVPPQIPGPASRAYAQRLRAAESRGVTYLADDFPVFWKSANNAAVVDVDGNSYTDLTSAFGVASVGHANPAVIRAIAEQAQRLPHGMGDVHPCDVRMRLVERLAALAPVEGGRAFLCSAGAEAVEFALKTAMLAVEAPDALAFVGGYHGLSYGTLEIAGNPWFRQPWSRQLRDTTTFAPFPDMRVPGSREHALEQVEKALRKRMSIGAVIVEPIQGRAGVLLPPPGFLAGLRALCDEYNALLILDEIFTGFGRTGRMFAAEREAVKPDIICLGKALGGGFPISAAVGSDSVMEAWPISTGEALHTSTYLGNPMGCTAALAVLDEIERGKLVERSEEIGERIAAALHPLTELAGVRDTRGLGAFRALELRDGKLANRIVVRALARGVIVLQAGMRGENIQLAPPLTIPFEELDAALAVLGEVVRECLAV